MKVYKGDYEDFSYLGTKAIEVKLRGYQKFVGSLRIRDNSDLDIKKIAGALIIETVKGANKFLERLEIVDGDIYIMPWRNLSLPNLKIVTGTIDISWGDHEINLPRLEEVNEIQFYSGGNINIPNIKKITRLFLLPGYNEINGNDKCETCNKRASMFIKNKLWCSACISEKLSQN